ncbi:MAG: VanZ family protein [Clostridia bacterium]|nr:VanZ family protein [Clostridia bacterium]
MKETKYVAPSHNIADRGFSRKRLVLCVILGICILANMILIYSFSAEDKSSSGNRSHGVTEVVVEVIVPEYPTMSPEKQTETIEKFHPPIRKIAHFCEFGLLGMLSAAFMCSLGKGKKWLWWVIPAVFCLLYAISDEVHQIFTQRGPAVKDVLIDFSGSMTGIVVMHLLILFGCYLLRKRKEKRLCE